ncbi:MAG: hypothetical protein K1X57_19840 [Gemmataceae bacterium]|nr:hypothetical protein [Gemmataceae bacterium]
MRILLDASCGRMIGCSPSSQITGGHGCAVHFPPAVPPRAIAPLFILVDEMLDNLFGSCQITIRDA